MSQPPRAPGATDSDLTASLRLLDKLGPALRADDRAETVRIIGELAGLRATLGEQWLALARIAAANGEVRLCRRAIALFVDGAGGTPEARYIEAGMLSEFGLWSEARTIMRSLPEDAPDGLAYAHGLGTAALYCWETAEARRLLERATQLRPSSGASWLSLAPLVDFRREPALADRLIAAERTIGSATPIERAAFHYALGKAHADLGDPVAAFAAVSRGAREMKPLLAYSRDHDRRVAAESVQGFDAANIAAMARRQSEPTDRAIFVMGLPRSGTTLVEQILTSHSAIADGGEINRLGLLGKDAGGLSYLALEKYVARAGAPEAARLWNYWLQERFPGGGRVVDKTPNTTRLLGFAAALLPDAPLIWLRRDPLDCAWSCFRTYFHGSIWWSLDLEDIAWHFRLEDELLAHWQPILGDRLLVVPYEELVTMPESWTNRILSHCGLAPEPEVFTPHATRRAVTTSSMMQVRRPINRDAIGSAEPYRDMLQPFLTAYRA